MKKESFMRLRDWVEPAHPATVKRFDDLVAIYTVLRDKYQERIDKGFDRASRQIGFVVATTLPLFLEFGEKGALAQIKVGAEHLRGTLFEKELLDALKPLPEVSKVTAGIYSIYLIWFDALRLKLRMDWVEPAHFRQFIGGMQSAIQEPKVMQAKETQAQIRWEVREPAHWFDPGLAISVEEAMTIEAIDHVYPDLKLAERITSYRQAIRRVVMPEVKEPAHFRQMERILETEKASGLAAELAAVLRRYGY